jgi:uncharacterized damage-inducible protein DinB
VGCVGIVSEQVTLLYAVELKAFGALRCMHKSDGTETLRSYAKTLNHILAFDRHYLDSLQGMGALARSRYDAFVPANDLTSLRGRQRELDDELIVFCDNLDEAGRHIQHGLR